MRSLLILAALCGLTACTTETALGRCVGAFQQEKMDPRFEYEISAWNVVMGVLFVEMIAPPVLVVLKYTHCPERTRAVTP